VNKPLRLGIVGHTNTGKTSLIRTLLRSSDFGDVRDEAGTTRHVESATIPVDASRVVELRDTPGLEDSCALAEQLRKIQSEGLSGRDCLQQCIANDTEMAEFSQEIKVLKQALACQLLMYVVDCREPVLEKYMEELYILQLAAIPILPVLNFINIKPDSLNHWKAALAERSLHAHVAFDTVAYTFESEKRLYIKLQTLLESEYALFADLIIKRERDWVELVESSCRIVSQLLLDTCRLEAPELDTAEQTRSLLQKNVRQMESETLQRILALMQFEPGDIDMSLLPVSDGQWKLDLFSPETLKWLGRDTASSAATGAALGAGVDLVLGGLSLGAAAAAGAALGAAWHTGRRFGKNLYQRATGKTTFQVDDFTLELLLLRQWWLLDTLFHRGHAATQKAQLHHEPQLRLPKDWPEQRLRLRNCAAGIGVGSDAVVETTTTWIAQLIHSSDNR